VTASAGKILEVVNQAARIVVNQALVRIAEKG
jgi:hypothetical protein